MSRAHFTYVTAHSPTLLSLLLRHRIFTYVTWRAAHVTQRFHRFNTGERKYLPRCVDLNYGILRIYVEIRKKIRRKLLIRCQKKLVQKNTICSQIKTLGKSYKSCRSVPHKLTPQQALRRVDICLQLISNPMDVRFIRRIVTRD